jgi:hypothetical protein
MRRGASIPELLVAMVVLLLGIWVVAAKFPQLSEIMREEGTRDKMARKAEQEVEAAKDNAGWVPTAVFPYGAVLVGAGNPCGIDESVPGVYDPALQPDWTDGTRPPNAVENMLNVIGETFRVPAPRPGDTVSGYFLKVGPAEKVYRVYQPIPLTRDDTRDPFARGGTPHPGAFWIQDDGVIRFSLPERDPQGNPFPEVDSSGAPISPYMPGGTAQIEVSYAWVDTTGVRHPMAGESVECAPDAGQTMTWTATAPVSAVAAPLSGQIVPNSVSATFRYDYEVVASNGTPTSTSIPVYVDWDYGEALVLGQAEEGKTLCVDYRLRTYVNPADSSDPDNGRRIPLAREVHRVPEDPISGVSEVALDFQHLDDERPVFELNLDPVPPGTPLASPPHVVAWDVETGQRYSDAEGTLDISYVVPGPSPTTVPGWIEGRISFPAGSLALGKTLLFYYRSLDRQTVQLQRAPATFCEDIWAGAARPAWALGRWFRPERGGTYDPTGTTLIFPDSCLSQTVRVEYATNGRRMVEVHTLPPESPAALALDAGPTATVEIVSVTGVSVKGLATWSTRGKVRAVSVETLLPSQLEPSLAREPRQGALQP